MKGASHAWLACTVAAQLAPCTPLIGELPRAVQLAGGLLVLAGVVVVKLGEGRAPLVVDPVPEPEPEPEPGSVSERPAA